MVKCQDQKAIYQKKDSACITKKNMLNIKALALTISKLLARLIYRMIERRIERVTDGCKVFCSILLKKSLPSKSFFFRKYCKINTFILANSRTKISLRGRKELPLKLAWEKRWENHEEIVLICMIQTTFILAISLQHLDNTLTNERACTINKFVDKNI